MKNELEIIEELIKIGQLEVEPLYYTLNNVVGASEKREEQNPLKRGKVYRCLKTKKYIYFVDYKNCVYKPGDYIYVESNRCDQPYYVAGVQTFKMTKRGDQLNVVLNWFYRPCQLPEAVYHTLVQDRRLEEKFALYFKDSLIKSRELFVSDVVNSLPISSIRGKCVVRHFKDILFRPASSSCSSAASALTRNDVDDDDVVESKLLIDDDTFFYILGYNAENSTLAQIQGEIRVGSSYQARLPEYNLSKYVDEYVERSMETLQWSPDRMAESDLLVYISAARSMAAITGVCNGGTTDDGCSAAAQDQTTINALISLHDNDYDAGRALQAFVRNSTPSSIEKKWSDDETKKFVRGLKQYGKNFFKIRKEFLSHKETFELVEFYYVWKKTEAANNQRPRQRVRRPKTDILRVKKVKPNSSRQHRTTSNEFQDFSSASENELDSYDGDAKDTSSYACHHCFTTTSKDWHHGGKDKVLLCTDCRIYYKKYGELRQIERLRTPPPFLFKPVKDCDDGGVKTRRSNKDQRKPLTPTSGDIDKSRLDDLTPSKSPGASSTGSRCEENRVQKATKKGKKRKCEPSDDFDDEVSLAKHKAKYLSKDTNEIMNQNNNSNTEASSSSTESQDTSSMSSLPDESATDDVKPNLNVIRKVPVSCSTIVENVQKNVYNFVDDDAFAKSVAGFRRQLIELSQNDSKLFCPSISSTPTTTSNRTSVISPMVDACKTSSVIKEIGKIKEEPKDDVELVGSDKDQNVIKEPEAKIDDTEHYRSTTAIFRRHWYRGESNSCSRTDLVFMPFPESILAKKREQRLKNHADNKEMQIKKELPVPKLQPTTRLNVPQCSPHQTGPNGSSAAFIPPLTSAAYTSSSIPSATPGPPSLTPVPSSAASREQMPALQRLKEYAAMSGAHGSAPFQQFFPGSGADPSLQNRILSGAYGTYEKERLEMELRERHKEKLQTPFFVQDIRSSAPPPNFPFLMSAPNMGMQGVDPRQWFAAQNGPFGPSNVASQGLPPLMQTANLDPVVVDRILATLSAERVHLERLLAVNPNPMLRLELDKVTAQLAAVAGTQHHTHSHTHSHTHLHIHPATGVPILTNDDLADVRNWPPPGLVNPEALLHQYASMFRSNPNMETMPNPNFIGLPCGPGQGFGMGQVGLEHLAAERLQQLQQQEFHRRIMMEREHIIAAQHQSIVQHNEMMRRLHDEGNYVGSSTSRPSAPLTANDMPLPPYDKR